MNKIKRAPVLKWHSLNNYAEENVVRLFRLKGALTHLHFCFLFK